uniref:Mos1 transposase HTH domain-containing protein n=1 Tax=Acrobeloides nanus TaxID=290746 RepID=A0A914CAG7_9BILA
MRNWLVSMRLLHGSMQCQCGANMKLIFGTHGKRGFKIRTFFEGALLNYKDIFKLSYFWAMRQRVVYAEFETGIAHRHVVHWYKKFRQVSSRHLRMSRMDVRQRNQVFFNFWTQVSALYQCHP